MPPPPPDGPLPPAILAALGLAAGCANNVCLSPVPCLDYATTPTAETSDTGTTFTACLDYAYPTGETGTDTGATDTGATALPSSRAASFERLSAEGVLPADVVERLRNR